MSSTATSAVGGQCQRTDRGTYIGVHPSLRKGHSAHFALKNYWILGRSIPAHHEYGAVGVSNHRLWNTASQRPTDDAKPLAIYHEVPTPSYSPSLTVSTSS